MSEYQELIKSFQKSRGYVRDFLIYGFKSREDFSIKSGRTYDNERRIEYGYYGFTLEDEIFFLLLNAIHSQCAVTVLNRSTKNPDAKEERCSIVPLKIFVSSRTGRRFLCGYRPKSRRFSTLRLDQIQQVIPEAPFADYACYARKLEENLPSCFGVSFGASHEMDTIKLTLSVREGTEDHIIQRLHREGRGGTVTRTGPDTWTYETAVFDGSELLPWIRTFIGRILSFESGNAILRQRFYRDIHAMAKMYDTEKDTGGPRHGTVFRDL